MVNESNIRPVVLLSKSDLLPPNEINKKITEIQTLIPDIRVVPFSNKNQTGLHECRFVLTQLILLKRINK